MMMENKDGLTSEDKVSNINTQPQSMVTVEIIDKTSQKGLEVAKADHIADRYTGW